MRIKSVGGHQNLRFPTVSKSTKMKQHHRIIINYRYQLNQNRGKKHMNKQLRKHQIYKQIHQMRSYNMSMGTLNPQNLQHGPHCRDLNIYILKKHIEEQI